MNVKVTDNTKEVLSVLEQAKQRGLEAIGLVAEGHAKVETPVDTGRLRNSMTHAKDQDSAYIGTNVEYGKYVEFGSRHNKAVHMLKRAITEHTAEYKKLIEESLKNA